MDAPAPDSAPAHSRSSSSSSSSSSSPSPARGRSISPPPTTTHSSSPKSPPESTPNPAPATYAIPPPSPAQASDSTQAPAVDSVPTPTTGSTPAPAPAPTPAPAPAVVPKLYSPPAPIPPQAITSESHSSQPRALDSTKAPAIDSAPAPTPPQTITTESHSSQPQALDSTPDSTKAPAIDSAPAPEFQSPQPRALDLAPDSIKAPAIDSAPAPVPGLASATTVAPADADVEVEIAPTPAQTITLESHSPQPRALHSTPDSTKAHAIDSAPAPAPVPVPALDSTTTGLASATTLAPADVDVEVELAPEKIEDEDNSPSFHCILYDTEVAYKIAQALLPGLASACVDNTTGGIFKTPASVAVEMRKEMVEYLTQRSETFVAETLILEENLAEEVSDHPYDIVANFVDDFDVLKRNWFSRVSGWLLSERREDRIDDLIQEMELNKFWDIERRESVAQNLLKNVDFKSEFHCDTKFKTEHELQEHVPGCRFRTVVCSNEGCNVKFMAGHLEQHDSVCPFKVIMCEQGCSDVMMRRDMDKHCITVCQMKLVNCRFYQVGCKSRVPQCKIENHLSENLHDHVFYILQSTRKEASVENLRGLVQQLMESPFRNQLEKANNARALMAAIKDVEAKIEPTEAYAVNVSNEVHAPTAEAKENYTGTN